MPQRRQVGEVPSTSTVAPGAITALLREVFRSQPVDARDALPEYRPGEVIGRFELLRELGRGGFGVVYEASDRQLRRSVAVKAVRTGGDVGFKEERLLREAEAAAQLSHPNIVTLFDLGRSDRGAYLVMELLRGRTLSEALRTGPLPASEAVRIGVDVARAVAHAHANGVVHRDLSSRNVFLCDDGTVKVLDFGMAQAFGHHRVHGGTVTHMAPEQYRGDPEDERTDVFALGVILHEMLAGRLPFPDAAALAGLAPAPPLDVPDCPALGPLVARMLAKAPASRPRDGREVLDALLACRPPVGPRPARARPARSLAAAGIAALAVVTMSLAVGRVTTSAPRGVSPVPLPAASAPAPTAPREAVPATFAPAPPEAARRAPESGRPRPRGDARVRAAPATIASVAPQVRGCRGTLESLPLPGRGSGQGVLSVDAEPYGEVHVNGQSYGETPLECAVSAGAHVVRVTHPLLGVREARLAVREGARASWIVDFTGR